METLLQLFDYNKKRNQLLLIFSVYCLSLLLVRAKITDSVYLFFLIWNLFLAGIPYSITSLLSLKKKVYSSLAIGFLLLVWLAFLPNSFYILTDLVHVTKSDGLLFYLDLIIISAFAVMGFILGIVSLSEFEKLLPASINSNLKSVIIPVICGLCGFGIYIGRVLRYNSWDIVSNPFELAGDIWVGLLTLKTILFAMLFGGFIYLSFLFKKHLQ